MASSREFTNKSALVVDVIKATSEQSGVSVRRRLGRAQELQGRAVFIPEVFWTRFNFSSPVFLVSVLRSYPALPTVVFAQLVGHRQTLVDNESPVSFLRPGVLKVVYRVGEHNHDQVPESPLVRDTPVPIGSGGRSVVSHVVFGGDMEPLPTTIFGVA